MNRVAGAVHRLAAPGRWVIVLLCLAAGPSASSAQSPCFDGSTEVDARCTFEAPRWVGEFATLGVNGVIGGLTAGLVQTMRGESFTDAFMGGALGGVVTYAGKRLAAERFPGAGAAGRAVSAAGASVSRNATSGELLLSRITLPVGPVWLEIRRGRPLGARLDPMALGWTIYGLAESELHFDATESLSAGTPVFRTRGKVFASSTGGTHAAGVTNAGVIFLAGVPAYGESFQDRALAHERVHVLQEDVLAILWTDPLASRAFAGLGPRSPSEYIAVNLSTELLRLLSRLEPQHEDRPWEMEAIFLAR